MLAYTLFVVAMLVLYIPVICLFILWETFKAFYRACVESVKPFIYAIKDVIQGDL